MELVELIDCAPWREAVTYRETWPHEYVVIKKDGQEELFAAICKRFCAGEGVGGRFFSRENQYLFVGDYKYWFMTPCAEIDLEKVTTGKDDYVLNRALIYRDRRDFLIKAGDDGRRNADIDGTFDIKPSEYNKGAKADNNSRTGRTANVPLRDVWENEALDFTPWLAENLDQLGEVLHLDLEEIQQEAQVGGFFLDILARDRSSGAMVAIENQLEWTNDSHLGQTLTYAGWHDARILIWVAPHFTQRHRDALEWLSRRTPYEIEVYGVELSAVKIGYSKPAAAFEPVVLPKAWYVRRAAKSAGIGIAAARRKVFFQPLVDRLRKARFTDKLDALAGYGHPFPSGVTGMDYCVSLGSERKVWVYIPGWPKDYKQPIFDELRSDRENIKAELELANDVDTQMEWNVPGTGTIGVWRDGSLDGSEEQLEETREWMFHYLLKFKKVFDPRIEEIIARRGETEDDN